MAGITGSDLCSSSPTVSSVTSLNFLDRSCGAQRLEASVTLSGSIPAHLKMQTQSQIGTSTGSYSWSSGWGDVSFSGSGPNTVSAGYMSAPYENTLIPDVTLYYIFQVRIVANYDGRICQSGSSSESNDDEWQSCTP